MSHGRYKPRHPRAPSAAGVSALSDAGRAAPAARSSARADAPRTDPLRIGPPSLDPAAAWHERGVRHECDGDLAAAIECYRWALRTGGPDAQAAFDLAYALAAAGRAEAAVERYRQVLELDATRQDAWANLGGLLLDAGDLCDGIDALRTAVALDPDDPVAQYNLADALDLTAAGDPAPHWQAFLRNASGPVEHLRYARRRERATGQDDDRCGRTACDPDAARYPDPSWDDVSEDRV